MDQQEFYLNQPSNHECFKLPEKDKKYLLRNNFLNEYFSDEDKAQVRSNLGITSLLDELKSFILAKLFDEEGNITFDLEPHEDAFDKVLSSAVIYNILLKYYTKEELDEWRESLIDEINTRIQELRDAIHVDDELKDDSEYPVQNKVLYEIINQINLAYTRLGNAKADREELLNYYTVESLDNILSEFYTKEQSDSANSSLIERIDGVNQILSESIQQTNSNLEQAVLNGRNQLLQAVDTLNQEITQQSSQLQSSISDVDDKVDQQVSDLTQSINNLDNKIDSTVSQATSNINNEITQQVSNLNQAIDNLDDKIDQQISNTNQSINNVDNKIDQQVSNLSQSINNLDNKIDQSANTLDGKIDQQVSNLNQSINNVDEKIDQEISEVNQSISNLDDELSQEISNTNNQVEQLGQSISQISTNVVVNGDNKTIKKENGILSTLLTIHQLSNQDINDESVESAYQLQNSLGEKIGDRIIINKPSDYSQAIEQLQQQIQQLQESQQKYIIIDESAYEQLTEYVQGAIYLVLEDEDSVNHTGWRLGDGLPIILSGEWQFGDNLPIILS